jgi:hypothetical protein
MDTTPRPLPTTSDASHRPTQRRHPRSAIRRGLGAAGAAVVVAFVGTAGLGVAQAQAAGVAGGLTHASDTPPHGHPHRPATHPANLPAATTTAVRYSFDDGELIEL